MLQHCAAFISSEFAEIKPAQCSITLVFYLTCIFNTKSNLLKAFLVGTELLHADKRKN